VTLKNFRKLCLYFGDWRLVGRTACRLAKMGLPPHYGLWPLANVSPKGYVAPSAEVSHTNFEFGEHCFIGEQSLIYGEADTGPVRFGERVHIHQNNVLQTGQNGGIDIGSGTHIQPHCLLSGFKGNIRIGENVEIAAYCAFYSYNHEFDLNLPVREQPISTAGGIDIGSESWIGHGVVILDGAEIGHGAVIAAGSVVNAAIPEYCIAAGNPARVIGRRS